MNPSSKQRNNNTSIIAAAAIGIIALAVAFFDLSKLSSALSPLFTGVVIALMVNIPMSALERRIRERCIAKCITYKPVYRLLCLLISWLLIISLLVLLCCAVLPRVISSVSSVAEKLPALIDFTENYIAKFGIELDVPLISSLGEKLGDMASSLIGQLSSILESAVTTATGAVISIYLLANKAALKAKTLTLLSAYLPRCCDRLISSSQIIYSTFSKYLCGIAGEAVIIGMLYFLTLTVFGFPYALPISLLCALLSVIPYAGPVLSCAAGFLLIVSQNSRLAVSFLIIFLAIQIIEGQLIYPRVVGRSVGLSPMWTLIAALVGARMGGFLGAMLTVPCFSAASKLINRDIKKRLG